MFKGIHFTPYDMSYHGAAYSALNYENPTKSEHHNMRQRAVENMQYEHASYTAFPESTKNAYSLLRIAILK